jgi:hypothetical protein
MQVNFPSWIWWILGVMLLLIVMGVCKADFSVGSQGLHFTQGLIK